MIWAWRALILTWTNNFYITRFLGMINTCPIQPTSKLSQIIKHTQHFHFACTYKQIMTQKSHNGKESEVGVVYWKKWHLSTSISIVVGISYYPTAVFIQTIVMTRLYAGYNCVIHTTAITDLYSSTKRWMGFLMCARCYACVHTQDLGIWSHPKDLQGEELTAQTLTPSYPWLPKSRFELGSSVWHLNDQTTAPTTIATLLQCLPLHQHI